MKKFSRRASAIATLTLSLGSFVPFVAHAADATDDAVVSSYVDTVRAALDRGKRFPTGRDISIEQPSGRSEVTFSLTRRGKVTSAKTTQSSNSIDLDDMAKSLVRRAKYAPFPATAWPGDAAHTFVVTYSFNRNPTGRVTVGEPTEVKAQ